ncbi:hypothetical protein ThimaDRAFT_1678 [Thiocapsa marina 5811]|uniref:Uncharacterized protein n=1 Tax=Thiocapsa marina 5811 TaxID=768671 RepID=F9U9S6_9GAMM|nr:hypothetical protein ThimaDRAFT_1678 [Thiocapsa marina 5811]
MNGAMWVGLQSDVVWVGLQSDKAEPSHLGAFVGLKPDPQCVSIIVQ